MYGELAEPRPTATGIPCHAVDGLLKEVVWSRRELCFE
jgi:hypothetical protein